MEEKMEEKNEQGMYKVDTTIGTVTVAKPAPVPTLQDLQNYILFLKSRIEKFEEGQTRFGAGVFRLGGKEWMREEREKEGRRK